MPCRIWIVRDFVPSWWPVPVGLLTEEARRLPGVQTFIVPTLGRRIHAISDLLAFLQLVSVAAPREAGDRAYPQFESRHPRPLGGLVRRSPIRSCTRCMASGSRRHNPASSSVSSFWLNGSPGGSPPLGRQSPISTPAMDGNGDCSTTNVSVIRPGIDPSPFRQPLSPADRQRLREEFGIGAGEI